MKNLRKQLVAAITLFISVVVGIVFLIFFLREWIEPKKVIVNDKFSYIVIKDEAKEKLAREIFKNIENNLSKEGANLKLNHSIIQELKPVDKKYKGLSDEVKDSISLYNIFNNNIKVSSCLKGKIESEYCKESIKNIVNFLKEKRKEKLSEAEKKIISMTPEIVEDKGGFPLIGLKDENLRANASTVLKYIKEQINKKEKGCYEDVYHKYVMDNLFKYIKVRKDEEYGAVNLFSYLKAHVPSNENSYEAILTVGLFNEGKICIHDLESPKCDIFIDKLLKDMEKVCREKRVAKEKAQKVQEEQERVEALNQQKRDNFLKSRGL